MDAKMVITTGKRTLICYLNPIMKVWHSYALRPKKLIISFRKHSEDIVPFYTNGDLVKRVSSFKFLSSHITEDLTWTAHSTILHSSSVWPLGIANQNLMIARIISSLSL